MHLSTHYYVLVLSSRTNTLFEAFRDCLIKIKNQGFPVVAPPPVLDAAVDSQLRDLARAVDECFDHYAAVEPLGLVVVGDERMQSAFMSVTKHKDAVIGRIDGNHTGTPARNLGQIVWPIVKEAISGVLDQAMRDLKALEGRGGITSGLEAVARVARRGVGATLLVEDDYHVRGSVDESSKSSIVSSDVDVRESIDDAVDAVIEVVLQSGGNVVFTPSGSLSDRNRIVLFRRGADRT